MRQCLATARLTDAVRNRTEFEGAVGSMQYRKCVPWKLKNELRCDTSGRSSLGWGFVISFEFDFFSFWVIWGTVAISLALVLLLVLYVRKNGPVHGQPGVAVAMFMAPFGVLATMFTSAYTYAKQNNYLK